LYYYVSIIFFKLNCFAIPFYLFNVLLKSLKIGFLLSIFFIYDYLSPFYNVFLLLFYPNKENPFGIINVNFYPPCSLNLFNFYLFLLE